MAGFEKQENHPCIRMCMLLPDRPGFDILNAETGIIIPKGSGIMNCCADEKTLTVGVEGRLDAACSDETEKEIRECIRLHPGLSLCLDLDKLEYISSSGIRVLLKFQKERPEGIILRNVPPAVYEVLDITGMTSMMDVHRKPRTLSVDGCEIIGQGAFGTVYRLNRDTVVKVFREGSVSLQDIEKELANAKEAFMNGVPTAIPFDVVRVGDRYGMVFELIDARNCNDLVRENPAAADKLIPVYAAFLKNLHSLEAKNGHLRSVRDNYLKYLTAISACLEKPVAERLRELLEQLPDTKHMIHGDIHLKNIMISQGEMILIDMDHLTFGDPVFDFASLYATYIAFNEDDPEDSIRFLGVDAETCRKIFYRTLECYLQDRDEETRREDLLKIQAAGYLRYLKILIVELDGVQSDLKEIQIRHAAEHLADLVFRISSLAL